MKKYFLMFMAHPRSLMIAGFLLLCGAIVWQFMDIHTRQKEDRIRIGALTMEVIGLRESMEKSEFATALKASTFASRLEEEAQKRTEAESVQKETQANLLALAEGVSKTARANLVAVIKRWRSRVAHVSCSWPTLDGGEFTKSGSGFLLSSEEIITNRHVVEEEKITARVCAIALPQGGSVAVDHTAIRYGEEDIAYVRVINPTIQMKEVGGTRAVVCGRDAVVGDEVLVLGYPSIGAKSDVTATDGIISGFDQSYYITSAKLDRGNSGGVAVHAKNDCYLGIPTFVVAGRLESLGRILDFRKVSRPTAQ